MLITRYLGLRRCDRGDHDAAGGGGLVMPWQGPSYWRRRCVRCGYVWTEPSASALRAEADYD